MATKNGPFLPPFSCDICKTLTSNKKDYSKHLLTRKHIVSVATQHISPKKSPEHICSHCPKQYESRSGLWRHMKNCHDVSGPVSGPATATAPTPPVEDVTNLTSLVMELLKSNNVLQTQMLEICKNNNTNNSYNNNHSNNKTFNLQFFLNEQCKDAMNISDFANSFDLQLSDLESVGELGYVEGITKIMVDKLNSMDIYKRPIHCSDAKRETLYVKDDDKWEKEEKNNPKLRYAIKTISFRNMKLAALWSNTHPESQDGESRLNDTYLKIIKESTGGHGEISVSEDKIIRRIVKEIIIEKN